MAISRIDVNTPALRRALAETAEEIRGLKKALRQTWTKEMAFEQRTLEALKVKATMLCVLAALRHGKHHLTRAPRRDWIPGTVWDPDAYHQDVAGRALERFGLHAEPVALACGGAA